jgi:hypothetical protein
VRHAFAHLSEVKTLAPATVSQHVPALQFLFVKTLCRWRTCFMSCAKGRPVDRFGCAPGALATAEPVGSSVVLSAARSAIGPLNGPVCSSFPSPMELHLAVFSRERTTPTGTSG